LHRPNTSKPISSFALFVIVIALSIAIHIVHVESFAFSHPHASFHGQGRLRFGNANANANPAPAPAPAVAKSSSRRSKSTFCLFGAESDMEELQRAARDPKAFEAYVLRKSQQKKSQEDLSSANAANNNTNRSAVGSESGLKSESAAPKAKAIKYVPIEQWDEERSKDADNMSWEEKVQFEGLKHGNRYRQNEILNHHLR
jgi:hypothetical protein